MDLKDSQIAPQTAVLPPDGDAAVVVARIDRWLRERDNDAARDWHDVLTRMHAALTKLCSFPLVQNDPVCQKLLSSMTRTPEIEGLDALVDLMSLRVAELLAQQSGATLASSRDRKRGSALDTRASHAGLGEETARPARIMLRL